MNEVDPRLHAIYSTDLWDDSTNAVLGQFFEAKTRSVYTTLTEAYCAQGYALSKNLHTTFKHNFAAVIDDAIIKNGKSFPQNARSLLLENLPRDLPCSDRLEAHKVSDTDPRVPLRGQNGVRVLETARRGLLPGAFIGVYRGKSVINLSEYKKTPPPGMNPFKYELEIESYTASVEHYNIGAEAIKNGITFDGLNLKEPSFSSVHICGAGYGNITTLVNDPSIDPMGNSDEKVDLENVCMCEIVVGGWPCLVMFATRRIEPGEELRYSYGPSFWEYVQEAANRLKHSEKLIADALAAAKEEAIRNKKRAGPSGEVPEKRQQTGESVRETNGGRFDGDGGSGGKNIGQRTWTTKEAGLLVDLLTTGFSSSRTGWQKMLLERQGKAEKAEKEKAVAKQAEKEANKMAVEAAAAAEKANKMAVEAAAAAEKAKEVAAERKAAAQKANEMAAEAAAAAVEKATGERIEIQYAYIKAILYFLNANPATLTELVLTG